MSSSQYSGVEMIEPKQQPKAPQLTAKQAQVQKKIARAEYRLPTKDEQIRAWEKIAFEINMHRMITGGSVEPTLHRIDRFVLAHNRTNLTIDEVRKNVVQAFWEDIAQLPEVGVAPAPQEAKAAVKTTAKRKKPVARKKTKA